MNNTKKILERLKRKMGEMPYENDQVYKNYKKYIKLIDKEIGNLPAEENIIKGEDLIKYIERYKTSFIESEQPGYKKAIYDILYLIDRYFNNIHLEKEESLNFSVKSDENNNKDGRIELKNEGKEWILTIPKGKSYTMSNPIDCKNSIRIRVDGIGEIIIKPGSTIILGV